jgi:hypothetical protein
MSVQDPRETIAESPMSGLQVAVVAITVALNALDGFDVLSISFASPGIASEWGIDRAALGVVLRWSWSAWRSAPSCLAGSPIASAGGRRSSAA